MGGGAIHTEHILHTSFVGHEITGRVGTFELLLLLRSETHQIYHVADDLLREIALTRVSLSEAALRTKLGCWRHSGPQAWPI